MVFRGAKRSGKKNSVSPLKWFMNTCRISLIIIVSFLGIMLPRRASSQLEADYWMFGPGQYVYFNQATLPDTIRYPTLSSQLFFGSGCTSYSDKSGNQKDNLIVEQKLMTSLEAFVNQQIDKDLKYEKSDTLEGFFLRRFPIRV
jgi:hypothetical protein